jgi:hypothetical protein
MAAHKGDRHLDEAYPAFVGERSEGVGGVELRRVGRGRWLALIASIQEYIEAHNDDPRPYD